MTHSRLYRLLLIIILSTWVISACQPAPRRPTPTYPATETPTAGLTPTSELLALDDGSPLPPRVIAHYPAGGQELLPGEAVTVTFDQAMNTAVSGGAFRLLDGEGRAVAGQVSWEGDTLLRFQPAQPLEAGRLYFVTLGTEAVSAAGVPLPEPFGFQFLTAAPLQVSQVFPADGASEVAGEAVITVIFNRPVVPLTIGEERGDLPQPLEITPAVEGQGEWLNTSVYTFRPQRGFAGGTVYEVKVKAGLQDLSGASTLMQDFTWRFSTSVPTVRYFVTSSGRYNPADNSPNVLLDEYFTIRFTQPMDRTSTESALSLSEASGATVSLITAWQEDDTLLVITPTVRLKLDTAYLLQVAPSAQAAAGGSLAGGFSWRFRTIPSPAILFTRPRQGETQAGFASDFYIKFASPMRLDTVKPRIQITPQPEEEVQWYYNEWEWSLIGFFLKPSTTYEIRFLPGMEDIYGNPIQTERVVRFTTAPYTPAVRLAIPYEAPLMRAGAEEAQEFYVSYTNVKRSSVYLYSLSLEQFTNLMFGRVELHKFLPPISSLVWEEEEELNLRLNERLLRKYQPRQKDGQPLAPGFYFLAVESPEVHYSDQTFDDYRLLYVASANLTLKSSALDGLVWLTDLASGAPLADQPVTLYDERGRALASGRTDANGQAYFELPSPTSDEERLRYALAGQGEVFGFASTWWGSGVSPYDYGLWVDYYALGQRPTVYLYTERPIYRPGQPVYFKGIVRVDRDLDYRLPDFKEVRVKIASFEETVYEESLSLSEFGTFDGRFVLDSEAALGAYSLEVYLPGEKEPVGSVSFIVAEYRKPEFQVTVQALPQDVLNGETIAVTVQADYYSGGGVANAEVTWTITSDPYTFVPPEEYATFSFSDREEDLWEWRWEGEVSEVIAEGTGRTDAAGRLEVEVPVALTEVKGPRTLTFEAMVTDVARTMVSGRATLTAHLSQVYPGVRPASYIGREGQEQTFEIVLLDWGGAPLPNRNLSLEIVERRWYSVQEQDPSGRVTWKSTVEEIPVERFEALRTDDKGRASVTFIPPRGGIYRARVTAWDERSNASRASAYLWVAGRDFIPWQQRNDRGFNLVTDKKRYQAGETAQVLIASPFQGESYALVTVERGSILHREVIKLSGNSAIYPLPITPQMAPNAYLSVVVMKGVDETNPRPNFRVGITQLAVDPSRQNIRVEIIPDREQAAPGEQVRYTVRTRDQDGRPLRAEVSLALSDLATLSLLPPNSAPILDHFYAKRRLGVWTSVPLTNNLEDYNLEIKEEVQLGDGMGGGGGKGEGAALGVVDVRQEFPDTAFWEARVLTNEQGEATVTVTLPDNLTIWRMDARAVTLDTRVGQAIHDLRSTRPLLVRPQTPSFFVANDEALLGAAVHNNTTEERSVAVTLEAQGLQLQSPATQTVTIGAGQQAYVVWKTKVPSDAKRVDLVFRAESGELKDASRPPLGTLDNQGLPVYRYAAPETVATAGQITQEGARLEGIALPRNMEAYDGELRVQISPSLAASLTDSLDYIEALPYESTEATISSFLPNVVATQALQAAGLSDPALESRLKEQVWKSLQRLYNWQNPDGGWGWWRAEKSDPLTSAYVVLGLLEAREAGYVVNDTVIERGLNFLRFKVQPLVGLKEPHQVNRQAFLLYVLARGGKPNVSSTVALFEQRQRLAVYAQAFLAQTLHLIDPADERLKTLLADLNSQAITSASGSHWEEKERDPWNWNTDTRTTAIVLLALSRLDPANPLTANAVRWLMSHRRGEAWLGSQETAWSVLALTRWMQASGELEADYTYAVALNGQEIGQGVANNQTLRQSQTFKAAFGSLLRDRVNRLVIARGPGKGNLYYTAHVQLFLPVEKVEARNQGIILARQYYRPNDLNTPVTEARQGELLFVRLTLIAPHDLHYVVVDDPLPAGLQALDQTLLTSPQSVEVPQAYSYEDALWRGWGWWHFSHVEYRDERLVLSASYLPAGTYVYTYLVRAGTAGVFHVLPATAYEFYFPEVYGRTEGMLFTVIP